MKSGRQNQTWKGKRQGSKNKLKIKETT